MKKLLLFILFIPLASFPQEGFEYILEDTIQSWCFSSFMDNQGRYISLGGMINPGSDNVGGLVVRFANPSLPEIKTFEKPDENIRLVFGTQLENNHYLFIGQSFIPEPNLYIVKADQGLEIMEDFYYSVPSVYDRLYIQDAFFDENDIIVLRGNLDDPAPGNENDIYLAKINTNGELLDTTIITDLNNHTGAETLKKLDGSGYYILGTGIHSKIVLDNDLNVLEYQDFPNGQNFNTPLAMRWLPDGNIIVANMANISVPGAYYDIRLRIVDEGFYTLKDTIFFDEGKNWPADFSSLDYVDPDYIWVVSHVSGWESFKDDWEHARAYIVDSEMNVKGAKYFAGDMDISLFSTKVLDDGACIITGMVPKVGNPYNYNAYIRKIMLDDILTGAEETDVEDDSDILLYPNPFFNNLHPKLFNNQQTNTSNWFKFLTLIARIKVRKTCMS